MMASLRIVGEAMTDPVPELTIVIPVYNGVATIGELVGALAALPIPQGGIEIVLVNDGSRDDSLAVCKRLVAEAAVPIALADLARNFGEHNAVMAGLRLARGRFVITMDDDLQNPPGEVVRLYEATRDGDFDVVYTRYDDKQHETWRNLGSAFHNRAADFLLDKPRGLYLSSFRCMSRLAVDQVIRYVGPFPYVDGLLLQATQRISTLTVAHLPRAAGRSNYTLRRLIRLWLAMALSFSILPLRLATMAGFAASALGFFGFLQVLVEAMIGAPPRGWSSLVSAILVLSGAQLLLLGVIGEYLGRLFLTVNGKPQAIVREIYRSPSSAE